MLTTLPSAHEQACVLGSACTGLQRLEAAYHVHVELQQREDARLEASELRNLVAAAIIEERLIAREERALACSDCSAWIVE